MKFGRYDCASFLTYFSYAGASIAIPVALVEMASSLGFPLKEGGMGAGGFLHLLRSVALVISMIFCGFVAARWGMRRGVGWAVGLMGLGITICAAAPSYGVLALALLLAGLGEGVIEGLGTPFVQALHKSQPGRYINIAHGFWSIGVFVVVLGSGALLAFGVSWRIVVGLSALLAFGAAAFILAPSRPGREYPEPNEGESWGRTLGHAVEICKIPRFWLFFVAMFLAGGGEFCITFWCASHIQLGFGASAFAGGVGTAIFASGMAFGRIGFGYLVPQRRLKELIFWAAIAGVVVTLSLPFARSLWFFMAMLFLAGLATAPYWPSLQSHCAERLKGIDTTMLFILLSCAGVPGCGFFTWLTGVIGNYEGGLAKAFLLVPACYLGIALLSAWDWLRPPATAGSVCESGH